MILIAAYRYLNINKESFNKKIYLLKLNLNIITIDFIIRIFMKNAEIYLLVDIFSVIKLLIYTATILSIIVNISKENYNFIFIY